MAQPTPGAVHIDAALSNIAIAYKNPAQAYIADMVFPLVQVDKQSDYYYVWTKDFWFRNVVQRRGPGALYAEGGFELSSSQYACVNKGLSYPIPWETVQNQDDGIDIERTGAEWLADQFMLDREIALKEAIMDASAWGSDTTLSGTSQWSDFENSDPLGDINTGKQTIKAATGVNPNVALINEQVWDYLRRHPDLIDLYKHTTPIKQLTVQQVAQAIGVDNIMIGGAVYNSAAEGQTFSGGYIWDKNMILMYVTPRPALRVPSAGYTFIWKQNGFTIPIESMEDRTRRRNVLYADSAFDQKITASDCGYEIINAVA